MQASFRIGRQAIELSLGTRRPPRQTSGVTHRLKLWRCRITSHIAKRFVIRSAVERLFTGQAWPAIGRLRPRQRLFVRNTARTCAKIRAIVVLVMKRLRGRFLKCDFAVQAFNHRVAIMCRISGDCQGVIVRHFRTIKIRLSGKYVQSK